MSSSDNRRFRDYADRDRYERRGDRPSHLPITQPHVKNPLDLPEQIPIPSNGAALTLPPFVQRGRAGSIVQVQTNHFQIQSLPVVKVYMYKLKFLLPPSSGRNKVGNSQISEVIKQVDSVFGPSVSDIYLPFIDIY